MGQEYWDKFWVTGSVEDYLSYKTEKSAEVGQKDSEGVCGCESDCADRDGAVYSARWGV